MDIERLVKNAEWKTLLRKFSPKELVQILSFEEGMSVADAVFTWDFKNDEVINYAIDIFHAIREKYPEEWNQDWKNELYVNELCELVLRYQEIYESCKRTHNRLLPDPPAHVLLSLANCYFLPPEVDTISQDEAINLLEQAIDKELTYESASRLRQIYKYRGDKVNYEKWDAIAKEAESKNLHVPVIVPDVLSKK